MSLYAQYILEREGKQIVEDAQGFATYFYLADGVYIENIYVNPEHRKSGCASRYADQIADIAKAKGFTKMYGSVKPSANGSTESLQVLFAYGFKLDSAAPNAIIAVKEI